MTALSNLSFEENKNSFSLDQSRFIVWLFFLRSFFGFVVAVFIVISLCV